MDNNSPPEIFYHAVMTAEMHPDMYAGDNCDQVRPRWEGYCDGDKEGGEFDGPIILDPTYFPPGTKVTVEVPICPECGEPADVSWSLGEGGTQSPGGHVENCECGFDWRVWTENEFS